MSIEFIDGFDHYNTATNVSRKWDSVSSGSSISPGRFGGLSWDTRSVVLQKSLTSQATRVMGFAIQLAAGYPAGTVVLASFADSGTTQVDIRVTTTGALQVTRNGTTLGTSAAAVLSASPVWAYLEFSATINSTTGSYDVHIGGTSVLTQSGINTQSTSNASSNQVLVGSNVNYHVYVDDLYIVNSLGTANNTFLGESQIFTVLPSGDDASNKQWTPSAGTNHYANVNEASPDDDTTYNSSQTVGNIDLYTFPSASPTGPILCVQSTYTARKDATGTRSISEQCKSGATIYTGSLTFALGSSYGMFEQIREVDPATSAAWLAAAANSAEFGVKLVA